MSSELSKCCGAAVVGDYYGDASVPGCAVYFDVCSKCGRPHDNPDYERWEQQQAALKAKGPTE